MIRCTALLSEQESCLKTWTNCQKESLYNKIVAISFLEIGFYADFFTFKSERPILAFTYPFSSQHPNDIYLYEQFGKETEDKRPIRKL